jgi:hypothetical protein
MNVLQALLDDFTVNEAELLGRHYQVQLGNESIFGRHYQVQLGNESILGVLLQPLNLVTRKGV